MVCSGLAAAAMLAGGATTTGAAQAAGGEDSWESPSGLRGGPGPVAWIWPEKAPDKWPCLGSDGNGRRLAVGCDPS